MGSSKINWPVSPHFVLVSIFSFTGHHPREDEEGPIDLDQLRQDWPHGVGGIGRVSLYRGSRATAV